MVSLRSKQPRIRMNRIKPKFINSSHQAIKIFQTRWRTLSLLRHKQGRPRATRICNNSRPEDSSASKISHTWISWNRIYFQTTIFCNDTLRTWATSGTTSNQGTHSTCCKSNSTSLRSSQITSWYLSPIQRCKTQLKMYITPTTHKQLLLAHQILTRHSSLSNSRTGTFSAPSKRMPKREQN